MLNGKIKTYQNQLLVLAFFLLFGSLSVSKGLQTICEVSIIILSIDKILTFNYKKIFSQYSRFFLFGLFFLMLVFGLIWTENIKYGLKIIKHQHRLIVIPLLFIFHIDIIKKWFKEMLLTFVLTAALASTITILFHYLPEPIVIKISETVPLIQPYPFAGNRTNFGIYSPFNDRLQFSNLIGLASIFTIFLTIQKYFKKYLLLILIPIIYCSIILGGRGGQVALLFGLFTYIFIILLNKTLPFLKRKFGKPMAMTMISSFTIIGLISVPYIAYNTNTTIKARYNQMIWELQTFSNGTYEQFDYIHFTSVRRPISWMHLTELIKKSPILGVGTGDVIDELNEQYKTDKYIFPVNIHSQYLYIMAGWGILGFILFYGSWGLWLKGLAKNNTVLQIGIVFTVFTLISMLSDAILIKQVDLMAFIVFITYLGILNKEELCQKKLYP